MDINKIRTDRQNKINTLYQEISYVLTLEYKLLVYKLMTSGHVKATDLANDSGLSVTRLYQIVDEVKKFIQLEGGEKNEDTTDN